MAARDQKTQGAGKWKRRVRDWLMVPFGVPKQRDITWTEVHNSNAFWLVIDGIVYDVTPFIPHHPGGRRILEELRGTDCSEQFRRNHRNVTAQEVVPSCAIGRIVEAPQATATPSTEGGGVVVSQP